MILLTFAGTARANEIASAEGSSPISSELPSSSQMCRDFAKKRPDLAELLDLDASPANGPNIRQRARLCWEGIKGAWSETLKELIIDPYNFMAKASPEATKKYLEECNAHVECKLQLYYEAHGYHASGEKLKWLQKPLKFHEIDILKRNAISRMNSSGEQNRRLRQNLENQKWVDRKGHADVDTALDPKQESPSFWVAVKEGLKDYKTKWQCLKPELQQEYFCHNLAMIIDPTIAAGIVAKSPKLAKFLRSAGSAADVVKVEVKAGAGIDSLPSALQSPLSKDFTDTLKNSPAAQELAKNFNKGEGLTIHVNRYDPEIEKTGKLVHDGSQGETIQAVFTAKSLREILPKAVIKEAGEDLSGPSSKGRNIFLNIHDSSVDGAALDRAPIHSLQMANTKVANPGGAVFSKSEVRSVLGLPEESRVVSLNLGLQNSTPEIVSLVRAIQTSNPNAIIVSQSVQAGTINAYAKVLQGKFTDHQVVKLSEFHKRKFDPDAKYIILNDTNGKMSAVYKAADVNVTAGPVNLTEPLNAQTPTVFYDAGSKYLERYNPTTFQMLADQAKATGGAVGVRDTEQMKKQLSKWMDPETVKPTIQAPYKTVSGADAMSPVERFTQNLNTTLEYQVVDSGAATTMKSGTMIRENVSKTLSNRMAAINAQFEAKDMAEFRKGVMSLQTQVLPRNLFAGPVTKSAQALKNEIGRTAQLIEKGLGQNQSVNSMALTETDEFYKQLIKKDLLPASSKNEIREVFQRVYRNRSLPDSTREQARRLHGEW